MGRECAPLVALAHLEGQSRRLPPWLSRPALGGTPPLDGGWPGSRTAIAQPPKGSELCAVPGSRMFSARGLFCGCASHSAVILLLLPADAIRILVRLRSQARAPLRKNVQSWSVVVSGPAPLQQPRAAMLGVPGMGSGGSVPSWKPREIQPRKRPSESAATSTAPAGVPPASTLAACATMSAYVLARPLAPQRISLRAVAVVLR
jgi:hypothetical protein